MDFQYSHNTARAGTLVVVLGAGFLLSACSGGSNVSDPFAGTGSPIYKKSGPIPKGGGRRHLGKPYSVAGRKFYPRETPNYDKTGIASWYGKRFHRRKTANGEWYDMNHFTAAHKTFPLPSYAKVTNVATGKSLIVRVNDRGPFVGNRIIDLSKRSADYLGTKNKGTATVRVQYIGPAPLNDRGSHLAAMNRERRNGTPLNQMIARANNNTGTRYASNQPTPRQYAASGYFVQVGAFGVRDNAQRAKQRAQQIGNAVIVPASGSYGTIYRVRIGPLASQSEALQVRQRAVNYGHYDAKVISN